MSDAATVARRVAEPEVFSTETQADSAPQAQILLVELHRKSERLRESEEKLRRLAAHLISVREEERAHIAREIHDELGQVLTGLKMEVTWLAKRLREKPLIEKTDSMCKLIDTTVQTVRKIATGLRPEMLDDMGLVAAVGWQAKEV